MNGRGAPGGSNVAYLDHRQQPVPFDDLVVYPSAFEGTTPKKLEWIVDGALLKHTVTLLAGDSDLGKSFVCQQLMVAAALGQPWLGRETIQCRSMALFSEDGETSLRWRQDQIIKHYNISHADLESEVSWIDADRLDDPTLMRTNQYGRELKPTPFWHQFSNHVKAIGVRLLIIDTAATTFRGKESDRDQVTEFIRTLTRLAREIDGAVLLTLHPPKDGISWFSGSGAWKASARSAMSIERPKTYIEETGEHADERVLWARKGNYSGNRPRINLRFQDGVFVAEEAPERKRSLTQVERHDLDYRLLIGLKRLNANGTAPPADPLLPKSLPWRAKRSTPEYREWPIVWLADAVDRLIAAGQVVRVELRGSIVVRCADATPIPGERPWETM